MIGWVQQAIRSLEARLAGVVLRGLTVLANDAGTVQRVQVSGPGGMQIDAERPQMYGFSSVPLPGCEAVLVYPGADPSHAVQIGEADRSRPVAGIPGTTHVYGLLVLITDAAGTISATTHVHSGVTTGGGVSGPPVVL